MGVFKATGFAIFMWVLYSYFSASFAAFDGAATATFQLVAVVAETSAAEIVETIETLE